jgi:hypothetical protein
MRNRYPGTCYRCGGHVAAGDGHFERFRGGWRTQHASCAIKHRGEPDPDRAADQRQRDERAALETGRHAQSARRRLRAIAP